MDIDFIKLQSCGNDYIVVDTFKNTIVNLEALPDLARQITSRRFGVGAVGLLFIAQGSEEKLRMLLYDPYGEEIRSDGLALRCLARYAFDAGLVNTETFRVQSGERIVAVEVLDSHNIVIDGDAPRHWQQEQILSERIGETFRRPVRLQLQCGVIENMRVGTARLVGVADIPFVVGIDKMGGGPLFECIIELLCQLVRPSHQRSQTLDVVRYSKRSLPVIRFDPTAG